MLWWLSRKKLFESGGSQDGNWWLSSEIIFSNGVNSRKDGTGHPSGS